jgi:hypothetical protein
MINVFTRFFGIFALVMTLAGSLHAGTASSIKGLYNTGVNNSGKALSENARDDHWDVTYARVGGSSNSTYTGRPYVVDATQVSGSAWTSNVTTGNQQAKWITAPGARESSNSNSNTNQGGAYLPGNGTSGTNAGYYVYRLAFTIEGTGGAGASVDNRVSISMTIAADDSYAVYVNPAQAITVNSNGTINSGGTAVAASKTGAWSNTSSLNLSNYSSSTTTDNSRFVIGTNYIYVVVNNSNSQSGSSGSTALNASGLLVYQTSYVTSATPVPEVGTWMPVALGVGLFGLRWWRRRTRSAADAPSESV